MLARMCTTTFRGPEQRIPAARTIRSVEWTAILNPAAGGRHSAAIRAALDARHDVECETPRDARHAIAIARVAFARGRGVIAVGGDGTFGLLTGPAVESGGLLALIPNGTGNDMAREFGIKTRDPLAAIGLLDHGYEARIDVGEITDATGSISYFPSVASIGFDAVANERANRMTRLPGSARYVAAALTTLKDFAPTAFELELDGGRHETRWAWLIAVGNASTYGGGMRIAPDAHLADGQLDLVTVGPVSKPQLLRQLPRVFRGKHVHHPSITVRHVTKVRIVPRGATELRCYASGDDVGPTPVEITCKPGALRVVVPATHALAHHWIGEVSAAPSES